YCLMRWGGEPRSIAAKLERRRFHEWPLEDTATVALELESGTGEIFLTWAGEERSNTIAIEGERGRIDVADERVVVQAAAGERPWSCRPALSQGSDHPDWFVGVADDFRAAVAAGGTGNLAAAVSCARLIDLAQGSSKAGGSPIAVG